jgi:hypothetical protein
MGAQPFIGLSHFKNAVNPSMGAPGAPSMARTVLKMEYPGQRCIAGAVAVCASIAAVKNCRRLTARFAARDHLAEIVP